MNQNILKVNPVSVLISILLQVLALQAQGSRNLDLLYNRLKVEYRSNGVDGYDVSAYGIDAATYLSSQKDNGSWGDIDYSDEDNDWSPLIHVTRLLDMAVAYSRSDNPAYKDASMRKGVIDGLKYWYKVNPKCSNWWKNKIGKQLRLGPIAILMRDELSDLLIKEITDDLTTKVSNATGQNLIWNCQSLIWAGVLKGDASYISDAKKKMQSTIVIASGDEEGIKKDGSFWQHGPMLATLAYGMQFAESVSTWAYFLRDLSFEFDQDNIETLSFYVLTGLQRVVYKGYEDYPCTGRYVARQNGLYKKELYLKICTYMKELDPENSAAYEDFIKHLKSGAPGVTGNRHYWLSDYQSHRRDTYHVGVKIASTRTKVPESVNGENVHGFYLGVGSMFMAVHGDEVYNIMPVWDWARIPGTTTMYKTDPSAPGNRKGENIFAGGASDGTYGVMGYDLNWDKVTGKKAWFMFDEEIVALGNSITSDASEPINTTVNQTFQKGETKVEYGSGLGDVQANGIVTLTNPKWILHNNLGYLFPHKRTVKLKLSAESGSWSKIFLGGAKSTITKDLFTLYFDHGKKPSGKSYEYVIVPNAQSVKMQRLVGDNPISIVANTERKQAVYHKGLQRGGIVFYNSGSVTLREGMTVRVNAPCILLVGPNSISASNPKNQALKLEVVLSISGQKEQVKIFNLPGGDLAGSSVSKEFTTTSIEQSKDEISGAHEQVLLWPNPVSVDSDKVTLKVPSSLKGTMNIAILDNLGNVLDEERFETSSGNCYSWDLCNGKGVKVSSGSYVLVGTLIQSDGMERVFKKCIGVQR